MFSSISNINILNKELLTNSPKKTVNNSGNNSNQAPQIEQFSSKASSAIAAYGMARLSRPSLQPTPIQTSEVKDSEKNSDSKTKTLNIFYFSDMHGELTGLTKLGAAKEACEQYCGGEQNLTVLGAGDLIAGSQLPVIQATVDAVNKMGMEATSLGNHERSRSDSQLQALADSLTPSILAINATENDKNCSVIPSKICKQGDIEFIAIGAQPLSPIENSLDIAAEIDKEVKRIQEERAAAGNDKKLPVVFLSHLGSSADKVIAENSETIDVILGGHSHHVEEFNFTGKNNQNVLVLQAGKNNALATVVKLDIAEDGTVSASSSKKINLKSDIENMCEEIQDFYGMPEKTDQVIGAAKTAEDEIAEIVSKNVGPKRDLAYVPEGYGYNIYDDGNERAKERCYSNPVSNIMVDAMLQETKDSGVRVSMLTAPTVKDTAIESNTNLSNYDVIGRILSFGGEITTAELPISKLYEVIEKSAQTICNGGGSKLMQVAGMSYSVDAEKAKARYDASVGIMKAEDDLKKAKENGVNIEQAAEALEKAKADYNALPGCVGKILILNQDGTELKINPVAIARGDFDGQTIKCAMDDHLAKTYGISSSDNCNVEYTGKNLTEVFEKGVAQVKQENDGVFFVDHNDVRISVKDKKGLVNGYEIPTGIHTKYWY